jgi:hypothetical protein
MTVLLGSIAYSPSIQTSEDFYYLSPVSCRLKNDFSPNPSGFIIDGHNPHATDTGYVVGGGLSINNLPTTVTTWAINSGHIAPSYLNDYYYRIHIIVLTQGEVDTLRLGNVLSEQTFNLEIWNAYLTTDILESIAINNLPDVVLSLPFALPKTFRSLQSVVGTITVAAKGIPTIDGVYTFVFDTETITLTVTGQRIVLWPFAPSSSYSESRQWATDVISSRHGEQRATLREVPRTNLTYKYTFRENKEYTLAKVIAKPIAQLALATPIWSEAIKKTNLTAGQTVITITTTNYEFTVGEPVVFWSNYDNYDIQEVLTLTSTVITLKQGLNKAFKSCWVMPVKSGYMSDGINLSRMTNHNNSASITFNLVEATVNPIWPTAETYLGLPVLTSPSVVSGGLSERFSREVAIADSVTGDFIPFDVEDYNRDKQFVQLKGKSHTDLYTLRRQFDYLQGKFKPFWLPSFNTDLKLTTGVTSIASGSTGIVVQYAGWSAYGIQYIRIVGDITQSFAVTLAVDNGNGTEAITFTSAVTSTINNVKRIEILTKVRLDSDNIEFVTSGNRITNVKTTVVEVLD